MQFQKYQTCAGKAAYFRHMSDARDTDPRTAILAREIADEFERMAMKQFGACVKLLIRQAARSHAYDIHMEIVEMESELLDRMLTHT